MPPNHGVTESRQTEYIGCFSTLTSAFQPFMSQNLYRVWLTLQVLPSHQSFSPSSHHPLDPSIHHALIALSCESIIPLIRQSYKPYSLNPSIHHSLIPSIR